MAITDEAISRVGGATSQGSASQAVAAPVRERSPNPMRTLTSTTEPADPASHMMRSPGAVASGAISQPSWARCCQASTTTGSAGRQASAVTASQRRSSLR